MKKNLLILFLLAFTGMGSFAQTSHKPTVMKPSNYRSKVVLTVSGKPSGYYALSHEKPSVINLNGPGVLKVITRARFGPKADSKLNYQFSYIVNGAAPKTAKFTGVIRSEIATFDNTTDAKPGQSRETEIKLGRGVNTIEFLLPDASVAVDARYVFTPTKDKKTEWISYTPMKPVEPVELVSQEDNVKYYRFSKEKPLKVELTGPTELRVFTRIENHFNMKGRIHYRLQVKDNNQVVYTYQLSSTHSETTSYKDNTTLIPGKACEFVLEVPKGKHIYEIIPLDEDKNTVLGRTMIPSKAVKLGD